MSTVSAHPSTAVPAVAADALAVTGGIVAATSRERTGRQRVSQPVTDRVRRDGKFFRLGDQKFYVKGVTTYSWYDGDSTRHINFAGLAAGATFASVVEGDPDVKMWTFGLHGGYRIGMGGNSVLTPYLDYDYVNARMHGFIENTTSGARTATNRARSATPPTSRPRCTPP